MRCVLASSLLLPFALLTLCAMLPAQTTYPAAPSQQEPSQNKPLTSRPVLTPDEVAAQQAEALRISKLAIINGRPYDQPSTHDTLVDYLKDTYGWGGQARSLIRAIYSEAMDKPNQWGQDFPGFMQRVGSSEGITAIVGNVRLAMELVFHEDLRYIPCHGCKVKAKLENALLAEITARHDVDGHRFFTLTPTIADFSGPIIAHSLWFPGGVDPGAGAVSARFVFATRIGQHLFQEFVLERRHKDQPYEK
jgi:hypothetical protein